jgi:hypothetical protein
VNGQTRQAFQQLVGEASVGGGQAAGQTFADAAACGTGGRSEGGVAALCQLAEVQPTLGTVRWTCKSSSPRRNTPRSARPASAADLRDAYVHGSMCVPMSSRPQTAREHSYGVPCGGNVSARVPKHGRGCHSIAESVVSSSLCSALEAYAPSVPAGTRSVLRAGSATLKPAAVPRLNLGVLRP